MIKGAIFDLDGTILDSMSMWDSIVEKYLISMGREPKGRISDLIADKSMRQACDYIRTEYELNVTTDSIIDGIVDMAGGFYRNEALLKPGAAGFLKRLSDMGIKMCIATADDVNLAAAALSRNKAIDYFTKIFTCNDVGHGKDEPPIFLAAADHLGFERNEIMVFEDALYAVKTASLCGFATTAVFDEFEKNQKEMRETADYYIPDLTDTEEFFGTVDFADLRNRQPV